MNPQMPNLLDGRTPGLSTTAPVLPRNRRVEKPLSPVVLEHNRYNERYGEDMPENRD